MNRCARVASIMAILLPSMVLDNPEIFDTATPVLPMHPQFKSGQPQFNLEALPDLPSIGLQETKEEGTIMEDYGYMIGAESAIEPMHMAPSGYLTEQYDSRFAVQAPVPEPETFTMLLVGAGLLGFRLRRKTLQS